MHQWVSADGGDDDCLRCGVVAPDHGVGVLSDHGPLPLFCPDVVPYNAHHFVGDTDDLSCGYCAVSITSDTDPATVEWECRDDNRPPIPEDHPNYEESHA